MTTSGGGADVLVVGAGLAGLSAAARLQQAGAAVIVLDKGAEPGGRVATRRFAGAAFDHGAQFFTVRSDEFGALVEAWRGRGCPITVWGHGLARCRDIADGPDAADTGGDGYPRHAVRGGFDNLAAHVAGPLDVRTSTRVANVASEEAGGRTRWRITTTTGAVFVADHAVLTPPVPQSLDLLTAGHTSVPEATRSRLGHLTYDPCIALLAVCDADPHLPVPGGVQFAGGPVQFLGENAAKGTSPVPALTVHLRGDVSRARYAEPSEALLADVLAWVDPWLRGAAVRDWQLKRWRYAQPLQLDDERAVAFDHDGARLVFAGDAFGEAKIEGAVRSGLAGARAVSAG